MCFNPIKSIKLLVNTLIILFASALVACGGEGGSPSSSEPVNQAPTVTIVGENQVQETQTLTLLANATDTDGSIANYSWSQSSSTGISVTLSGTDSSEVTFVAPAVTEETNIALTVSVVDDDGASASKEIEITIMPIISSFTITGLVTDKVIADAKVEVLIGEKSFTSTANSEGVYSVFIEVDDSLLDTLVKIIASGSDNDPDVEFISQLSTVRTLVEQAGGDTVLTLDENFSVNITNVTTAEYVLIMQSEGDFPTTDTELVAIKSLINTDNKIYLAALIKLVVDNDHIDLPAGITNTYDLVSDEVVADNFAVSIDLNLLETTIADIINDDDLIVQEFKSWSNDFSDVNFRNCVKSYIDKYAIENNISSSFEAGDLSFITELYCSGMEISRATGLKFLTGLRALDLSNNSLISIEIYNGNGDFNNQALQSLNLNNNQLSSIILDDNINLKYLNLSGNQLSTLNIKNNTKLISLWAKSNKLTYLDVSKNSLLEELNLSDNLLTSLNSSDPFQTNLSASVALLSLDLSHNQLVNIDITANIELDTLKLSHNLLTTLNTNQNIKLTHLDLSDNQLKSLNKTFNSNTNISKLVDLIWFDISNNLITTIDINDNIALTWLDLSDNQLSDIDSSNNVALEWFDVSKNLLTKVELGEDIPLVELNLSNNQLTNQAISNSTLASVYLNIDNLTTLDLSQNQLTELGDADTLTGAFSLIERAPNLTKLDLSQNKIHYFRLKSNSSLTWLSLRDNQLTDIDVGTISKLAYLDVGINQLTDLVVSNKQLLTVLKVDGNQLNNLDTSNNPLLLTLDVQNQELTSIDVSNGTALESLFLTSNKLTSIDISSNIALTHLHAPGNQLTSIDLLTNSELTQIDIAGNQLTSLDISKNLALTRLHAPGNQLTSIDVSNNIELLHLSLNENLLTSIDVSKNTALIFLKLDGVVEDYSDDYVFTHNHFTHIDLSKNINLVDLSLYGLGLTSLDLTNNTKLKYVDLEENNIAGFDFTQNPDLIELYVRNAPRRGINDPLENNPTIGEVDLSNNTKLIKLALISLGLTHIDLSNNVALDYLDLEGSNLSSLDVTKNISLKEFYISGEMEAIFPNILGTWPQTIPTPFEMDLSNNVELVELRIISMPLVILDLSKNTELLSVYVKNCLLVHVDVSTAIKLKVLRLTYNFLGKFENLTEADIPQTDANAALLIYSLDFISSLTELQLEYNVSGELNLMNNIKLEQLYLSRNLLNRIDVSNMSNLLPGHPSVDERVDVIY